MACFALMCWACTQKSARTQTAYDTVYEEVESGDDEVRNDEEDRTEEPIGSIQDEGLDNWEADSLTVLSGYSRYERSFEKRKVSYKFLCDFPKSSIPNRAYIQKWLLEKMGKKSQRYNGDMYDYEAIAKHAADVSIDGQLEGWDDEEIPYGLSEEPQMRAWISNSRFVTLSTFLFTTAVVPMAYMLNVY